MLHDMDKQQTAERGAGIAASGNRREIVVAGMAIATLQLLTGCSTIGLGGSDLDKAYSKLDKALAGMGGGDAREARLASIARRIATRCRELTHEHEEFREQFDALSRKRETAASELNQLVEGFYARRTKQRNELLHEQNKLRKELTREEWAIAAEALAYTQEAYTRPSIGGS